MVPVLGGYWVGILGLSENFEKCGKIYAYVGFGFRMAKIARLVVRSYLTLIRNKSGV